MFGDVDLDKATGIAIDNTGNVYVAGLFAGTTNLGGPDLVNDGATPAAFVASYSPAGAHRWSIQSSSLGVADSDVNIALDRDGNVYVAGAFAGAARFGGPGELRGIDGTDVFLVSYTNAGTYRWAAVAGGTGLDRAAGIAADVSGNVYVTGSFTGEGTFAGVSQTSAGGSDAFILSHTSVGAPRWSSRIGGVDEDTSSGVAIDSRARVHIVGSFSGTLDFRDIEYSSVGSRDVFVASFEPTSIPRSFMRAGGSAVDSGADIAVDSMDNVYLTGTFAGTSDFGGTEPSVSNGTSDVVVASFSDTGAHRWSVSFGGALIDQGSTIAIDHRGVVHVGGIRDVEIARPTLAISQATAFIRAYQGPGALAASITVPGPAVAIIRQLAVGPGFAVCFVGEYVGGLTLGAESFVSAGNYDGFLACLEY